MKTRSCLVLFAAALGTNVAYADPPTREDFDELAKDLPALAPMFGFEAAKPGPPTWCAGIEKFEGDAWQPHNIRIDQGNFVVMIQSARLTCLWPKEPAVQKAAGLVLQEYINYTGLPAAQAAQALKARLSPNKWDADLKKVCENLPLPKEINAGEEKAFMSARRALFGCPNSAPMWEAHAQSPEILAYLDASATPPDEIVRLAWLLPRTNYIFSEPQEVELSYITDQIDYPLLTEAGVLKMLDEAPYKGNATARTVILESWGRTSAAIRLINELVQKQSKDADWKELLTAGPQRGIAAWTKSATQFKDAIARSAEFEVKLFGPSRKALRGCYAGLKKDFVEVAKTLPHGTAKEFTDSLSDPVLSLLFSRLVMCAVVDLDPAYAERLRTIASNVRWSRGPRVAAQYAALDVLSKILADRTKFPVRLDALRMFPDRELGDAARTNMSDSKIDTIGWAGDSGAGTVASMKKVADGVQISFVKTKGKYMSRSCVDTNRIVTFDSSGRPIYYQACKDTGMVSYDSTPGDIIVPADWVDGIKAGTDVEFDTSRGQAPNRTGLPKAVYTDKTRTKLVNFNGIGL